MRIHLVAGLLTLSMFAPSFFGPAYAPWQITTAFAQQNITVENIVLKTPVGTIRIPKLEAEGSSVSGADIKNALSGPDIKTVVDKLASFSATRWSMPEIRFEPAVTKRIMSAVFKDVVLEDIANGRIGHARAKNGESWTTISTGESATTSIGAWAAEGFDIVALTEAVLSDASRATGERKPIYDRFTIEGYESKTGGSKRIRIGQLMGRDFRLRASGASVFEIHSKLSLVSRMKIPTTPDEQTKLDEAIEQAIYLIEAYSIGEPEMRDFYASYKFPEPMTFSVARLGLKDFVDARIGELTMTRARMMKFGYERGRFALGKLLLKGLDLGDILRLGSTIAHSASTDRKTQRPASWPADARMTNFDAIAIEGVDVDALVRNGPASPPVLRPLKLSIGKLALDVRKWSSGMPVSYSSALENAKLKLELPTAGMTPELAASLNNIELSLNTDVDYDEAARRLTIHTFEADLPKYAQIKLKSTIEDVHPDVFSQDSEASQRAIAFASAKSLDIELTDRGFIALGLAEQSAQTGMRAAQLREQMAAMPLATLPQLLGQSQETMNLARAMSAFVMTGGTVKIVAKSLTGVGVTDFANIPAIMDKVEIKALVVPPSGNR